MQLLFKIWTPCLLAGALISAASCGGEGFETSTTSNGGTGSGGSGSQQLDLPGDTQLGTLTPSERALLCDDLRNEFDSSTDQSRMEKISCARQGYTATNEGAAPDSQEVCQAKFDECTARGIQSLSIVVDCVDWQIVDPAAECASTITLDELRECYRDFGEAFETAIEPDLAVSPVSCEEILAAGPGPSLDGQIEFDSPDSCLQLATQCPDQ